MGDLVGRLQAYSSWRGALSDNIGNFRDWLRYHDLGDTGTDARLQRLLNRLADDKLTVAFVAEFSRGKTALINAIFFADYGGRLLPSTAGRTTMCPTELLYEEGHAPMIRLLPIETRATEFSTSDLKQYPDQWYSVPLDVHSEHAIRNAFEQVSRTRRVDIQEAKAYGLYNEKDASLTAIMSDDGMVEIPCWRHAIINFPHPLLKQGLIILDTPGLNAVGTEPELTLNLLPSAHAVLFVLAADTGATRSDVDVWRNHVANIRGQERSRLVVLNKIDGLWDELKSSEEIEEQITKQVNQTGELLGLETWQIFPVSAQKGLVAKVQGDDKLLEKSRLPNLENALSDYLIPSKQEIVRDTTQSEVENIMGSAWMLLESRLFGSIEQLEGLKALRGKNESVIEYMIQKLEKEKENFEKAMQRFQALRSVYSEQSNTLLKYLDMDDLRELISATRAELMHTKFLRGMRKIISRFLAEIETKIRKVASQVEETYVMMEVMYKKFSEEHGLGYANPVNFSTRKFQDEIERLQSLFMEFGDSRSTISKCFDVLIKRILNMFEIANRDMEGWLRTIISPMEKQMREHQTRARKRVESIKDIHKATNALEDRIAELEQSEVVFKQQLSELSQFRERIRAALMFLENRELTPTIERAFAKANLALQR